MGESAGVERAPLDLGAWTEEAPDDETPPARPGFLSRLPALAAMLAIVGWTAFYLWANRAAATAAMEPAGWTGLITGWTVPVLLICVVWLLAMRTSTREAVRFGDAASLLSRESAMLETRLVTVNRELSLAREFIAAQSRDLESLGRVASERLSANAERLQALVVENGARVESIGHVSETALDNMEKLRGQLPVIASSAKDVTNNIANAGRTAHAQIEEMIRGFKRLNEFGQASETQVLTLREHVNETLVGLAEQSQHLEAMARARFAELTTQSDQLRAQLDRHEVDALTGVRSRAKALAEELEAVRLQSAEAEREAMGLMASRIAALREEGGQVSQALNESEERARESWKQALAALEAEIAAYAAAHERSADDAATRAQRLNEQLGTAQTAIEGISAQASASQAGIEATLAHLAERMAEAGARLEQTEARLASLTESGVRLFELVHASAEQAEKALPRAFGEADAALEQMEARATALAGSVEAVGIQGTAFASNLDQSRTALSELAGLLEGRHEVLRQRAAEHLGLLERLSRSVNEIDESQNALGQKVRGQLADASSSRAARPPSNFRSLSRPRQPRGGDPVARPAGQGS
jgi:chromosome segregation ATPase